MKVRTPEQRHKSGPLVQGRARQKRWYLLLSIVLLCVCSVGAVLATRFYAGGTVQRGEFALAPWLSPSDRLATDRAQYPGHGQMDLPPQAAATATATYAPSARPTLVPVASPVPQPVAIAAAAPSGVAMPLGDLPGWHQIFAEDFAMPAASGGFPGSYYSQDFTVYPNNTPDTAGQRGAPSRYEPSQVVSVSGGLLNEFLHTSNGTPMGAALLPDLPGNHLYGKYTVRFRSDALPGFKTAWLLWPDSERWPQDGEIDFPENDLGQPINGFVHHAGASSGSDQTAFSTNIMDTSWHTASLEWLPGQVNLILDGQLIGSTTDRIPSSPMHWVLQTEACFNGCPSASVAGNLQIDWITAYTPA